MNKTGVISEWKFNENTRLGLDVKSKIFKNGLLKKFWIILKEKMGNH